MSHTWCHYFSLVLVLFFCFKHFSRCSNITDSYSACQRSDDVITRSDKRTNNANWISGASLCQLGTTSAAPSCNFALSDVKYDPGLWLIVEGIASQDTNTSKCFLPATCQIELLFLILMGVGGESVAGVCALFPVAPLYEFRNQTHREGLILGPLCRCSILKDCWCTYIWPLGVSTVSRLWSICFIHRSGTFHYCYCCSSGNDIDHKSEAWPENSAPINMSSCVVFYENKSLWSLTHVHQPLVQCDWCPKQCFWSFFHKTVLPHCFLFCFFLMTTPVPAALSHTFIYSVYSNTATRIHHPYGFLIQSLLKKWNFLFKNNNIIIR